MLLNKDGFWLKSMKPEDEWGFMYEDRQDIKFGTNYPDEWERIKNEESGQFYSDEGLFTFTTVRPLQKSIRDDYFWKVIGHVPQKAMQENPRRLLLWIIILDGFLITVIAGGSWFLARSVSKRRQAEKKIFELNGIMRLLNKILRHDILNDLTVIGGQISMFTDKTGEDKYFTDAIAAIKRSKDLVAQMKNLELAASEERELKTMKAREVIDKCIQSFSDIKFTVSGDVYVTADEALCSVIENLVRNARMHGGANQISFNVQQKGNYVEIIIADNGKGIPDEIKESLFQEGFKYGETGNTGLGLYIVRKTIERYGGTVSVGDNKPQGAIFTLLIPKASEGSN